MKYLFKYLIYIMKYVIIYLSIIFIVLLVLFASLLGMIAEIIWNFKIKKNFKEFIQTNKCEREEFDFLFRMLN